MMSCNSESVSEPFLSFCIIVKNESQNLSRCLASVQAFVDEMIVVDTGSEDDTVAIAQQYGARVSYFSWCNDFAAARNFAIAQASGKWILTLDADEELVVERDDWKDQLALAADTLVFSMPLTDPSQPMTELPALRVFRNLPELRYAGRYHEQLRYQGEYISTHLIQNLEGLKILHYGYEAQLLRQKDLKRNIPLLEEIRQQEELSLLLLLTLGNAYLRTDQLENARTCWAEAFDRIAPNLIAGQIPSETIRLPALLFTLGLDLLHEQKDYETAMLVCRRGLEWFPTYPPLNHLTGSLQWELGFPLAAAAYFEKCLQMGREGSYFRREPFDLQFITVWPAHDLGLVYLQMNQLPQAIAAFELALSFDSNYQPAQEELARAKNLLNQDSSFSP